MSKYTTEVRYICETAAGYDESKGYNDVDKIIEDSVDNIFSFDFPIFDETYRNVLCIKILRHFYTREIGFETVGLWKLKLQTKLNEIMPYYNQLYTSELLKFNPLYDVDLNTTHVGTKDSENDKSGSNSGSGENTTVVNNNNVEKGNSTKDRVNGSNYSDNDSKTNYDLYSDTPQGALDGVEDEEYLTNARKITESDIKYGKKDETGVENENYKREDANESTSVGHDKTSGTFAENDKYNSTESYVLHVVGKQAGNSYSKLLKEFRSTFLNIDMEVISNLNDLFMNLW